MRKKKKSKSTRKLSNDEEKVGMMIGGKNSKSGSHKKRFISCRWQWGRGIRGRREGGEKGLKLMVMSRTEDDANDFLMKTWGGSLHYYNFFFFLFFNKHNWYPQCNSSISHNRLHTHMQLGIKKFKTKKINFFFVFHFYFYFFFGALIFHSSINFLFYFFLF